MNFKELQEVNPNVVQSDLPPGLFVTKGRFGIKIKRANFAIIKHVGSLPVFFSAVAGVTFEGRQKTIREIVGLLNHPGSGTRVLLLPEPQNKFDPNAIKVSLAVKLRQRDGLSKWLDSREVGYIPRELAAIVKFFKEKYDVDYNATVNSMQFGEKRTKIPGSIRLVVFPAIPGDSAPLYGVPLEMEDKLLPQ